MCHKLGLPDVNIDIYEYSGGTEASMMDINMQNMVVAKLLEK